MASLDNASRVLSVSELNRSVRALLEQNLPLAWVGGEISNLTIAASGHWYFSLKDAQAQVRCVMFRHKAALLDFRATEGMQVEVRAVPGLYEARGEFQLGVEFMRRAGLGALFEAFERLKAKLQAEGLFDAGLKRPLPRFPRRIGIVTSPAAAALRDVLTTLKRRMPSLPIVLYPCQVQGAEAPGQIVRAIEAASRRGECDVLIVCRGGGSIEDLWAFNDEAVARAIAGCAIPVVAGVGHETDFTIADFVADHRAPTPTAAAELVSPNRDTLRNHLDQLQRRLGRDMERGLAMRAQRVDYLSRRLVHPGQHLAQQARDLDALRLRMARAVSGMVAGAELRLANAQRRYRLVRPAVASGQLRVDQLAARLARGWHYLHEQQASRLASCQAQLKQLNPEAVLERGYSIVRDIDGRVVRAAGDVQPGELLRLTLHQGWLDAQVLAGSKEP